MAQVLGRGFEFISKDQGIERYVTAYPTPVEEGHQPWQVGHGKVVGTHARVEALQAEVDRVGTIFDGGAGTFPITSRCQALPGAWLRELVRRLDW